SIIIQFLYKIYRFYPTQRILSPLRLPIPPHKQIVLNFCPSYAKDARDFNFRAPEKRRSIFWGRGAATERPPLPFVFTNGISAEFAATSVCLFRHTSNYTSIVHTIRHTSGVPKFVLAKRRSCTEYSLFII
ncbi:MAG: hypothetical protein NC311_10705, partial [Muribaculaceae bacterium]|nr:hypothetical protein [Muribaculaceae bacterium]